jgi:hypothetical protein
VPVGAEDECWLFDGPVSNKAGHRRFTLSFQPSKGEKQKGVGAHRFMYELTHGAIPEGLLVRHSCDNPGCVNPKHLLVGTHKQNTQDAVERGRMRSGATRLTPEDVARIRELYAKGTKQVVLAQEFGVTQANISAIVTRKNWSKV